MLAALDLAGLLAIAIGIAGLGGLVFTALRFRRDDTSAIVSQQSTILRDMQALNSELRSRVDELQAERDRLREQIDRLEAAGP
jgi:prephenate dehydrogenase